MKYEIGSNYIQWIDKSSIKITPLRVCQQNWKLKSRNGKKINIIKKKL